MIYVFGMMILEFILHTFLIGFGGRTGWLSEGPSRNDIRVYRPES
jgi:hypothetical protein